MSMKCKICGTRLEDGMWFCPECGTKYILYDTTRYFHVDSPIILLEQALMITADKEMKCSFVFQNTINKTIEGCYVSVRCFGLAGEELEPIDQYIYMDLVAGLGDIFGETFLVTPPDVKTRKIELSILKIVFADGEILDISGVTLVALPKQKAVVFREADLQKKYELSMTKPIYYPIESAYYWICGCGCFNRKIVSENKLADSSIPQECCQRCGKTKYNSLNINWFKDFEQLMATTVDKSILNEIGDRYFLQGYTFCAEQAWISAGEYYKLRRSKDLLSIKAIKAMLCPYKLWGIYGLKNNGTVICTGNKAWLCDINSWRDIIAIDLSTSCICGIKKDGTVITAPKRCMHEYTLNESKSKLDMLSNNCSMLPGKEEIDLSYRSVDAWKNVVSIKNMPTFTMALRSDGTVLIADCKEAVLFDGDIKFVDFEKKYCKGNYDSEYGPILNTKDWIDIIEIAATPEYAIGLKSDGTVRYTGNLDGELDVGKWNDITHIESDGMNGIFGITNSGKVVCTESIGRDYIDVSILTNIKSLIVGNDRLLGLRKDGKVVVSGNIGYGQENIEEWDNIVKIIGNDKFIVGLRADRTVIATGINECGQWDYSNWIDIVDIVMGASEDLDNNFVLGIESDGSIVAAGDVPNEMSLMLDWNLYKAKNMLMKTTKYKVILDCIYGEISERQIKNNCIREHIKILTKEREALIIQKSKQEKIISANKGIFASKAKVKARKAALKKLVEIGEQLKDYEGISN